jgi:hypothetical protein
MAEHRWIFELAKQSAQEFHPQLRPDIGKILELVKEAIGDPKHYCRVARFAGEPRGLLVAFTAPCLWAQRTASHIVLWRAGLPGAGAALLRDYRRWVLEQPNLRVAGWSPDCAVPDGGRISWLMQRAGFKRTHGAYLMYPREVRNGLFVQSR